MGDKLLYDSFEIRQVHEYQDPRDGTMVVETIDTPEDLAFAKDEGHNIFWTVYGHRTGWGHDAISDFKKQKDAKELLDFLTELLEFKKNALPFWMEIHEDLGDEGTRTVQSFGNFEEAVDEFDKMRIEDPDRKLFIDGWVDQTITEGDADPLDDIAKEYKLYAVITKRR